MKHTLFLSCSVISSLLLVSLYSVAGYPANKEAEVAEPGKIGWGPPQPAPAITTNGTTVSAGQTIIAGNASASVISTDDVYVDAYDYYGGAFLANQTMNNTADNSIFTGDNMEIDVDDISVTAGGAGAGQAANVFSNTLATAADASVLTYTEQPVNTAAFSAGTLGVSTWATASNGTNLGVIGTGSGWKQ